MNLKLLSTVLSAATLLSISSAQAQIAAKTNVEVFKPKEGKEQGYMFIGKMDFGVQFSKNTSTETIDSPLDVGIPLGKTGSEVLVVGFNLQQIRDSYNLDQNDGSASISKQKFVASAGLAVNNAKTNEYMLFACEVGSTNLQDKYSVPGYQSYETDEFRKGFTVGARFDALFNKTPVADRKNSMKGNYFIRTNFNVVTNGSNQGAYSTQASHSGYPLAIGKYSALGYFVNLHASDSHNADVQTLSAEAGVDLNLRQNLFSIEVGLKAVDLQLAKIGYKRTSCYPTLTVRIDLARLNGEIN